MCKKSSFPVVFNIFLAFFITLGVTIYLLITQNNMTPMSLIINMIRGFALNMTLETIINLPGFGNIFVKLFHLKMDGVVAYFVRILFIVILLVILMSFLLMFCDVMPVLGSLAAFPVFLGAWIAQVPGIFVVAYITAIVFFIPCTKATQALCTKD